MKTIAMIFPGQGSQHVGMGRTLAETSPLARAIFERADATLGRPLSRLCFEGPEEELRQTVNTQPALYTVSAAALAVLRAEGIEPDFVAGHSLGEYSALHAAGVFDFETGLKLVQARGAFMQAAAEARPGTMAAILSLDGETVEMICGKASEHGTVVAANWNSPEQVVISGEPAAVAAAVELAKAAGSRRSVMLPVSGAFHSPLVAPAVKAMEEALARAEMHVPTRKFVANISAEYVADVTQIRKGLAQQIVSCVCWSDSVQRMAEDGAEVFIEVGAGKVLTGLLRRIDKELVGAPFGEPGDLDAVKAAIQ